MKIRHALTGAAAAALLVVGAGAGDAAALTVTPYTGAAPCASANLHQYTRYHGTICYSNAGNDDLSSSAFWTIQIYTGCCSRLPRLLRHQRQALPEQGFRAGRDPSVPHLPHGRGLNGLPARRDDVLLSC